MRLSQEIGQNRLHPTSRKERRGVVEWHKRSGRDHGMPALLKKLQVFRPNFVDGHSGIRLCSETSKFNNMLELIKFYKIKMVKKSGLTEYTFASLTRYSRHKSYCRLEAPSTDFYLQLVLEVPASFPSDYTADWPLNAIFDSDTNNLTEDRRE